MCVLDFFCTPDGRALCGTSMPPELSALVEGLPPLAGKKNSRCSDYSIEMVIRRQYLRKLASVGSPYISAGVLCAGLRGCLPQWVPRSRACK